MRRALFSILLASWAVACGGTSAVPRTTTAQQALASGPEWLELETPSARRELLKEIAQASLKEAGLSAERPVLFPLVRGGQVSAAPGFDSQQDLLAAPDAGASLELVFDSKAVETWSEERPELLSGLSEREAAELLARTLIHRWELQPSGPVQVERVSGAAYAAAYMDGVLRINPSFVYLVASTGPLASP